MCLTVLLELAIKVILLKMIQLFYRKELTSLTAIINLEN